MTGVDKLDQSLCFCRDQPGRPRVSRGEPLAGRGRQPGGGDALLQCPVLGV